jgi:hypothetical protein
MAVDILLFTAKIHTFISILAGNNFLFAAKMPIFT